MNHLLRELAPIPDAAWAAIDDEARQRLTPLLTARTLVDWDGPGGWKRSATNLGRTEPLDGPPPGAQAEAGIRAQRRRVLPLTEFQVPFTVSRQEIRDIQRGAADVDLADLDRAARHAAEIENRAIFHGWPAAGITGVAGASSLRPLELGEDPDTYPSVVARAVDALRRSGIGSPYTLAIGPDGFTRIVESTEHGGYLLVEHLRRVLDGAVVRVPGLNGGVVLSRRGGDFRLVVGQDLSIGYSDHDADTVRLYLEESFTFRALEPDAAVPLTG